MYHNPQSKKLVELLGLHYRLGNVGEEADYLFGTSGMLPHYGQPLGYTPTDVMKPVNPEEIDIDGDNDTAEVVRQPTGNPEEIDIDVDGGEPNPEEIDIDVGEEANPEEIDIDDGVELEGTTAAKRPKVMAVEEASMPGKNPRSLFLPPPTASTSPQIPLPPLYEGATRTHSQPPTYPSAFDPMSKRRGLGLALPKPTRLASDVGSNPEELELADEQ